jgi:hypothetical protein
MSETIEEARAIDELRREETFAWIDKYGTGADSYFKFCNEPIDHSPGLVWYYQKQTWGGPQLIKRNQAPHRSQKAKMKRERLKQQNEKNLQ